MTLTADRNVPRRNGDVFSYPVAAGETGFAGAITCVTSAGFAAPGTTSTTLKTVGVAQATADNNPGLDGAIQVEVRRGVFRFDNSAAADLIALADVNADCYIVDDETVAKTNGTATRSIAGKVRDVDADGVWVEI